MATEEFDLIVIGAGPGGYVAAIRAAQLGMKVACVEKESRLGGTCLRIGCIPSKALLESSHRYWEALNHFQGHGIQIGEAKLDLAALLKRKDRVVQNLCQGIEGLFKKNQVTRYFGTASIPKAGQVEVSSEKEAETIHAKSILIATGSQSASLKGVELDGDRIGTSTEALSYPEVPERLVVIGAGYIGLEMGSIWSRLGSQVTVLEYLDRILPGMDSELAGEAKKQLQKQGLEFQLGRKVVSAKVQDEQGLVECEGSQPIHADRVLLAVGRVPNTKDLGLEAIGVETDSKGTIQVDENFQTSVPGVYAIGDVIPGPMLAHKAEEEGIACVETLAGGAGHVDYQAIPAVVYTQPEIGSVGQTEDQLKESGVPYRKGVFHFRANGRAHSTGHIDGRVKILADQKTDRLLGAHIIGQHAGDLINEAAMAMAFSASAEDLARTCHAHPTLAEAIKEAALASDGRALHA